MPARIVVVHDMPDFLARATAALHGSGFDVLGFGDPMAALEALFAARTIELLVTRVRFPTGKPHGISLALTVKMQRPDLKVLFADSDDVARSLRDHVARGSDMMSPA